MKHKEYDVRVDVRADVGADVRANVGAMCEKILSSFQNFPCHKLIRKKIENSFDF